MSPIAAFTTYAALFLSTTIGGELCSWGEFEYPNVIDWRQRVEVLAETPRLRDLDRFGRRADGPAILEARLKFWQVVVDQARRVQLLQLHHADQAFQIERHALAVIDALRELEDGYREYWWVLSRRVALAEFRRRCPWHWEEGVLP